MIWGWKRMSSQKEEGEQQAPVISYQQLRLRRGLAAGTVSSLGQAPWQPVTRPRPTQLRASTRIPVKRFLDTINHQGSGQQTLVALECEMGVVHLICGRRRKRVDMFTFKGALTVARGCPRDASVYGYSVRSNLLDLVANAASTTSIPRTSVIQIESLCSIPDRTSFGTRPSLCCNLLAPCGLEVA